MIPVYNCAHLLRQSLQSVLMQYQPNMQVQVVDDGSTDANVEALVREIGGERVTYYRQPENVGSLKNFETCLKNARGRLVHILHADDRVCMGYYQKMETLFARFPQAGAAFCRYQHIDENNAAIWCPDKEAPEDGVLHNWLLKIATRQRLQFCCITVKRSVYENLGGFYGVTYGEDWEMWARIAQKYAVVYTPEVLAEYRTHSNSISSRSYNTAQNIRDIKWVIAAIQKMVPETDKERAKKEAYKNYAAYVLVIANNLWHTTHNKKATHRQIKEGLAMHPGLGLLYQAAKIYAKMLLHYK